MNEYAHQAVFFLSLLDNWGKFDSFYERLPFESTRHISNLFARLIVKNWAQLASKQCFPSIALEGPIRFRSSTKIIPTFWQIWWDNLRCQSFRLLATYSCSLATFFWALCQLLEPSFLRQTRCCSNLSFGSASLKNLWRLTKRPLEVARKLVSPTSIPIPSPWGIRLGTETSHCRVNITYQPLTLRTILACLIVVPSGIVRDWWNLTDTNFRELHRLILNGVNPQLWEHKRSHCSCFLKAGETVFLFPHTHKRFFKPFQCLL